MSQGWSYIFGGFTEYVYKKTDANEDMKNYLSSYRYMPTFWLPIPWMKIFFRVLKKPRACRFELKEIILKDESTIVAASYGPQNNSNGLLVVVPDMCESHEAWYCCEAAFHAAKNYGWRTVVFNQRGLAGANQTGKNLFGWHLHDDLAEFIQKISKTDEKVFLIGFGLGGTYVQMYLAKRGEKQLDSLVQAGVAIGPIYQADKTFLKCDKNSILLSKYLKRRKAVVQSWLAQPFASEILRKAGISAQKLASVSYITEFDYRIVCPTAGFTYLDEYYKAICDPDLIHRSSTPSLWVSSRHDPAVE